MEKGFILCAILTAAIFVYFFHASLQSGPYASVSSRPLMEIFPKSLQNKDISVKTSQDAENYPIIVTGASANHMCSLLNMLRSVSVAEPTARILVYDLSPTPPFLEDELLRFINPQVVKPIRKFAFSSYPDFMTINPGDQEAGQYAWKPLIIKEVVDEFGKALWMDSGNLALPGNFSLQTIESRYLAHHGFFSPQSANTPMHWIHAGMFQYYGMRKCCAKGIKRRPCCCCGKGSPRYCTNCPGNLTDIDPNEWLEKPMCNGAVIAFRKDSKGYEEVLKPLVDCALHRECIGPLGPAIKADRRNHRQDQAALTFLSHQSGMGCSVDHDAKMIGLSLHNDNAKKNTTYCEEVTKRFMDRK
eukprot:m.159535 g.159535  ORF g.159535 m.159535 type:complete len:358 (+) comp15155_c0_seq4:379-1452(+)